MTAVRTRRTAGAPEGASRTYTLAPAGDPDAVAWASNRLRLRGWTVIEEGWRIGAQDDTWVMVELWAIPPIRVTSGE